MGYYDSYYGGNSWGSGWGRSSSRYDYYSGYSWTSSADNEDELAIKESLGYITPGNSTILNHFDRKSSLWSKEQKDKVTTTVKNLSRIFYKQMIMDNEYFKEDYTNQEEISKYTEVIDILEDKYVPGFTPIKKAINLFHQIVETSDNIDEALENLSKTADDIEFDENWEDKDLDEANGLLIPGGEVGGESIKDSNRDRITSYGEYQNKTEFMKKISLISGFGEKFTVEKEINTVEVHNSKYMAHKKMTSFSQLSQVSLYQRLMPDFQMKLAKKDLLVEVPVVSTTSKQKIIVLLDDSGSMDYQWKIEWVTAILADRLKYCIKEECEMFISKFEYSPNDDRFQFFHVHDRESAKFFTENFKYWACGGDTNVGEHIDFIAKEIHENKRLHNLDIDLSDERVECLIINDGCDSIKTKAFKYKTNAISLSMENQELKKLCLDNGGKYISIIEGTKKDVINEYE